MDNFDNVLVRDLDVGKVGTKMNLVEQVNILLGMDCYFLIRVKVVNVESYCNCFRMNLRQEGQDTYLHSRTFLDTIH